MDLILFPFFLTCQSNIWNILLLFQFVVFKCGLLLSGELLRNLQNIHILITNCSMIFYHQIIYTNDFISHIQHIPCIVVAIFTISMHNILYTTHITVDRSHSPSTTNYVRPGWGRLHLKPPKFEHIFVAVITFFFFLLCKYFWYQLVAYCVCFKMVCKKSL